MADFVTTLITPAAPPAPSLVDVAWEQNVGQSFAAEMKASATPRTPIESGGSGGPRPTMGLIFPRGM